MEEEEISFHAGKVALSYFGKKRILHPLANLDQVTSSFLIAHSSR